MQAGDHQQNLESPFVREGTLLTGGNLKRELRRIERHHALRALAQIAPAVALVLVGFLIPLGLALSRSIENGEIARTLPGTSTEMRRWDGQGLPPEAAYAALADDLKHAYAMRTLGVAGRRLNLEITGFLDLLIGSARSMSSKELGNRTSRQLLAEADPRWGETRYWAVLKRDAAPFTDFYFLTALDLERSAFGAVEQIPEDRRLYVGMLLRSLWISVSVTAICLVLAYPMSLTIASLRPGLANILLTAVLLPFWTSALVRSAAWLVLLQREGLINATLLSLGLATQPQELIFNRLGVVVALSHVLLPYMVLTLYAVMRGIDPHIMRAARSLGANAWQAFRRVYLPQTLPGIAAGCLLVFILAIGSYVTPALIGGRHDQMIAYFIAFNINQTVNWGLAAALSVFLLSTVLVLYLIYARIVGIGRLRVS
jgi:putative spermidine/putrescine transport system permease protein